MMSGIYDVTYAVTFEEVTKPETVQLYVTDSPFSFSVKDDSASYASIDDDNTVSFENVGSTDPDHKYKGLKFNGGTVNSDLYDSLLIEVENLSGDGTDTGDFVLCFALKGDNKEYYRSITVTNVDGIQRFVMLIPEGCTSLENSEVFINSDDAPIANTTEGSFTLSVAYFKAPTVDFNVPEYSGRYFTGDEIEILPADVSDGLEYSVSVSFEGAIVQPTDGKFKAESAGEYIISYQTTIYGEEVTRSVPINVTELALDDWDAPNYSDKVYYEDDRIEVKPLGSVADNKGNQHDVTVEVSFQINAEVSEPVAWENGSFTAKAGIYTITYSVQLNGDTPSEVKTVTINVTDRILDWEAPDYNQEVKVNTKVLLHPCTPKDNAGKDYPTDITVYLKNGSEMDDITETMVKDGVFTPSQTGFYVITYTLTFQGESQERTVEVTVVDEEALVLDPWSAPVYDGTYYETKKIQLQSVTVNDSEDSPHVADITVTKDGADVTSEMVSEGFFTPTIAGDYVVSYTITYGSEESEKKEVKTTLIRVQALTLSWNNLPEFEDRFEGDTIIVPTVDVVDNSGEEYRVAIIVKRNGEGIALDEGNSFEAPAGEYTVEYEVTFKGQKTRESISFNVRELVLQSWSVSDSLLVSVNEAFQVPMPEVLDNAGNEYPVEIKVSGAYNPEIKDGSFTPIRMGMYTISYSVSFKGKVVEKITTVYAVGGALAVKTGQDSGGISVSDAGNNAYRVSFDFNNLGSLVNQYRKISLDGNFSENTYNAIIFRVVYDTPKTGNNNICHLVMENEWKSGAEYTDHYLKDTNAAQIFILPVDGEFKAMQSSIFKSLNIMVNTDGSPVESTKAGSFVMEAYWYYVVTPDLVNAPSYEPVVQGETVNIKEVYADRASDGKLYTSTYVVTGPDGQEVDITNGAFVATQTGVYKIIYTLNGTDESKEYTSTVTCVELELNEWSTPASSTALKGDTIEIPQIVVSDNAGNKYTASITIKAPNAQESVPVPPDGRTFTASEIGDYEITYTITWRTAGGEEQSESKTYIITVKDPIVQAKEQGFAELESYVDAKKSAFQDAYSQNALEQIDQALSEAKAQVESAATVEDINAAVQAGKAALDAIVTDVTNRLIFGNVRVVGGDGNNQLTLDKVTIVNDSTTDKNTTPGTKIEMKISFKFSADYKGEGIAIAFDILNFEYFNNMHTKNGAVGFDTTGLNFDLKLRYEADTDKGHGVTGEKTLWSNRNNGEEGYYNACSSLNGLQNVTDIDTVYLYLMPSGTNAAEGRLVGILKAKKSIFKRKEIMIK